MSTTSFGAAPLRSSRGASRRVALGATVLAAGGLLAVGACAVRGRAPDAGGEPAEARAIRAARLAQNAALARGDLAAADSAWTADVTVRTGLGRLIQGRAAYRAAFAADTAVRYERTPTEIVVSARWPLAEERGRWAARPADGPRGAPILRGRYAAQWVRSGGRWRIRSELFVALECAGAGCAREVVPP